MINSIKYFEEKCINRFEKLEDEFIKSPSRLAEYVYGITDELHKLGLAGVEIKSIRENNASTNKGCFELMQRSLVLQDFFLF